MAEHPIMFRADMALAILEGRKTQTRRRQTQHARNIEPGDTLWVREPLYKGPLWTSNRGVSHGAVARYQSDHRLVQMPIRGSKNTRAVDWRWKRHRLPSIFMPKDICRLRLRVTAVRMQAIGLISHEEALTEGVDGIDDFAALWRTMHGNPAPGERVDVIEFKLVDDSPARAFNAK